jgi:hypothetical protein
MWIGWGPWYRRRAHFHDDNLAIGIAITIMNPQAQHKPNTMIYSTLVISNILCYTLFIVIRFPMAEKQEIGK